MTKTLYEGLISLLYLNLFLPSSSVNGGGGETGLIIPWKQGLREDTIRLSQDFIKAYAETQDSTLSSLGVIENNVPRIVYRDTSNIVTPKDWLFFAVQLNISPLHRSLLEQILTAYGSYTSPVKEVIIPAYQSGKSKPVLEGKLSIDLGDGPQAVDTTLPPFWKWYGAFIDKYATDMARLSAVFSDLFVPIIPTRICHDPSELLQLPLPNIVTMFDKANRIYPSNGRDSGTLRAYIALKQITFGFRNVEALGMSRETDAGRVLSQRYQSLIGSIGSEARRLAKCNDDDFRNAHVESSVESITNSQFGELPLENANLLSRRNKGKTGEDDGSDAGHVDDVPIGLPSDNFQAISNEAEDPSAGLDNALDQLSEQGGDSDDKVSGDVDNAIDQMKSSDDSGEPGSAGDGEPTEDGTPDASTDPGNGDDASSPKPASTRDARFSKLWGTNPIKLDGEPTLDGHLYRTAVNRMNEYVQNDNGDGIEPTIKSRLKDWCRDWLWLADTSCTDRVVKALKLQSYLKS